MPITFFVIALNIRSQSHLLVTSFIIDLFSRHVLKHSIYLLVCFAALIIGVYISPNFQAPIADSLSIIKFTM